jgi:hypothetical protein
VVPFHIKSFSHSVSEHGRGGMRGPKSSRDGNMMECKCHKFLSNIGDDIWIDAFLMPPIPIVLRCSFLFLLLASTVDLVTKIHTITQTEETQMASWEEEECEGIRAVGVRTLRKAMIGVSSQKWGK